MNIAHNISLKPYNTFGIDAKAKHFVSVKTLEELKKAITIEGHLSKFILGGGSNLLLTKDIDALVIHLNIKGIEILSQTNNHTLIKANAGENWHEFVCWCLKNDFGGIENLSLIPGNVGTAPMQNIGAYGVEVKDVFYSCEGLNTKTGELKTFTKQECNFGYRESIFKKEVKGKFIITSVTFKLTNKNHRLYTSYGAINDELSRLEINHPTIQDISKAVINIRQSKLPDPSQIGNSGSFFKNPIISVSQFEDLKSNFPNIPSYKISETQVKIPAGWLIEKAGFKGKTFGNYGVHDKQALVLVNYGGASGNDIYKLAVLIQNTINRLFKIKLEAEVNII